MRVMSVERWAMSDERRTDMLIMQMLVNECPSILVIRRKWCKGTRADERQNKSRAVVLGADDAAKRVYKRRE